MVLSIAFALALYLLGSLVNFWLIDVDGGWFNYTPNSTVSFVRRSYSWQILIWLVAVAIWTVVTMRLFRSHADEDAA